MFDRLLNKTLNLLVTIVFFDCLVLYLALLDQVREFRNRHWLFTKEYIIKYTSHPVATGMFIEN
jgi:hypothetical protein